MPSSHLFSLRVGHAFRQALSEGYAWQDFGKDLLAGVTVGIIAIPLAMALAIASGVAPQYGLYTAIIGGFVIALTGGSRYSVSGPTAAFVVILYPVAQAHGLAGLLLASVMAGVILVIMALLRLGRLIAYIPQAVVLGFTSGIAVVIATLQVPDLLGLPVAEMPLHFLERLGLLWQLLPQWDGAAILVSGVTLLAMLVWRRLRTPVPAYLVGILAGTLLTLWLRNQGVAMDTIGSRFSYWLPDGTAAAGVPPFLPHFEWPWLRSGANGVPLQIDLELFRALLPTAFAIAMLGAIESLLCAVVLDGMTGKKHSANSELLGQGLGNIITPFLGGITATAALARSAANVNAGARSPIAAMIHALVVLAGLVFLAPWLAWLPMSVMAALLVMVAWNMSEAHKCLRLLASAPRGDVLVFVTCFSLTVLVDMTVAITTGTLLAAILFVKDIAEMTRVSDMTQSPRLGGLSPPQGWRVFKISGPLFFAAADRVFAELAMLTDGSQGMVLYMDAVPVLDAGGLAAFNRFVEQCAKSGTQIYIADLQFQPLRTLARAGIEPLPGTSRYFPSLSEALQALQSPA